MSLPTIWKTLLVPVRMDRELPSACMEKNRLSSMRLPLMWRVFVKLCQSGHSRHEHTARPWGASCVAT